MLALKDDSDKFKNIPSLKQGTEGQDKVTGRKVSKNSCGGIVSRLCGVDDTLCAFCEGSR
jgi:hypothetical protein